MNASASAALEKQVEKFWLLEGYNDSNKPRTKIEKLHEKNFEENVTRTKDGRFQVRLTFNDKVSKLGTSLKIAEKRFMALERNFSKIPEVKLYYGQFMNEYIQLGHMTLTGTIQNVIDDSSRCFLPHHAVFKSDGTADKIRVVFDGSARTSTGVSLNETLEAGPKILNDIFPILIKFRTFKYAFSADICKMYRQILIHPDDRRYQQILWRDDPAKPLGIYKLNTVTYGLTSSPYAAIKCIKMLADAECQKHSKTSETIHEDFYVDDVLTGANTLQETIQLRNDLVTILKRGCFGLSKWASNSPEILLDNTAGDSLVPLERKTTESKTLGLLWDTNRDCFRYSSHLRATKKVTKRSILSISSQIFDPLGLLSPVTVKAKMLMQELWSLKLGWDESVPTVLHSTWNEWRQELHLINQFEIPRYIFNHPSVTTEVHGFADASEKAYGGVIYIRTIQPDCKISVNILCAKSRVPSAPHMGGLWESAVKSAKHHLKRVAGNALFSFEEMQTLLTQIEACLKSRPLTPLSSDPNDLNPLTPGHFLTGAPLNAIPEQDTTFTATNRLFRWQRVSQAQQHFWKRWSKEYLGHLQHRRKWKRSTPDVTINDLVIIREDNTPPVT
jgi:hypothetical protein